ncbi:MAG: hypothetical protein V2I33_12380 [Kangiellaceae bacterium]|jgi:hypothetical protein|nr:hypothetical protein [Kangiellaceae bacterium]
MFDTIILLLGSFFSVFLLGLNSQLVKDGNVSGAFGVAWFITLSNMLYTKIFVLSDSFINSYLIAGLGSSVGIVCSIWCYRALANKSQASSNRERTNPSISEVSHNA